jgi:Domain of unknown function (DUF1848)
MSKKYASFKRIVRVVKWPKVLIDTFEGKIEGVGPQVISASRSTDIPAFYADWFMGRLEAGYVKWVNPFNHRPLYVSFENTRAIVFWSKNPEPILKHLNKLKEKKISFYFQFTVNDYENEGLEPNVPALNKRLETFKRLADHVGKERVIWRYDPLVLTRTLNVLGLIEKVKRIGEVIHPYTEKLVFSFADISKYAKVERNLKSLGIDYVEFDTELMKQTAGGIAALAKEWGIKVCSCAEKIDLSMFGIMHNKCIDDELLLRISNNDSELAKLFGYSGVNQHELFSDEKNSSRLKDKGQRAECGCVRSKDIGQYNTCSHLCVYCYANSSAKTLGSIRGE